MIISRKRLQQLIDEQVEQRLYQERQEHYMEMRINGLSDRIHALEKKVFPEEYANSNTPIIPNR